MDQQIIKFKVDNGNKESQETSQSDELTNPEDNGEQDWTNDPTEKFNLIQNLMKLMIISTNHFLVHPKFHQLITY